MEICKRENKSNYSCYIFDCDNGLVWKKGYDQNDDLYWQVVNYSGDSRNIIRIDIPKSEESYNQIDALYNEMVNSKKDNIDSKDTYYIDDINEYDNFRLYNPKENLIHWVSDTGKINTEELYIYKDDEERFYSVIFFSQNPNVRNIKIIFSTNHSKYGNFSEAFRRDFGRTLDVAFDKYDECFEKIQKGNKQYLKKAS